MFYIPTSDVCAICGNDCQEYTTQGHYLHKDCSDCGDYELTTSAAQIIAGKTVNERRELLKVATKRFKLGTNPSVGNRGKPKVPYIDDEIVMGRFS